MDTYSFHISPSSIPPPSTDTHSLHISTTNLVHLTRMCVSTTAVAGLSSNLPHHTHTETFFYIVVQGIFPKGYVTYPSLVSMTKTMQVLHVAGKIETRLLHVLNKALFLSLVASQEATLPSRSFSARDTFSPQRCCTSFNLFQKHFLYSFLRPFNYFSFVGWHLSHYFRGEAFPDFQEATFGTHI